MTRASAALLRLAALKNAASAPLADHQRTAISARSYGDTLTEGERWFLGSVLKLSVLNDRQQRRLNEIASKVERGRK